MSDTKMTVCGCQECEDVAKEYLELFTLLIRDSSQPPVGCKEASKMRGEVEKMKGFARREGRP